MSLPTKSNFSNVLLISNRHKNGENCGSHDSCCNGIKFNCKNFYYVDYLDLYLKKGKNLFERHIENLVTNEKIEVIFFTLNYDILTIDIYFLERLSKKTMLVMFFLDTELYFESIDRYYAQFADLVIVPGNCMRYKYENLAINAHAIFSTVDSDYYKNYHISNKDIDVSFVGNCQAGNRMEYINYLKANGIKVQTYGYGGSDNGYVSFEDMISIFNRSKISLNFTSMINVRILSVYVPAINQRLRQLKGRSAEVAFCGGFVLSQYALGIEDMFAIGKEFDVFSSKEEMLQKIRFYLANPEKRMEIAKNGYQRALSQYETKDGFKIIFDKLKNLPPKQSYPLYLDDIFLRSYASYRFFYLSCFLFTGSFFLFFKELWVLMKQPGINLRLSYRFAVDGLRFAIADRKKLENYLKYTAPQNSDH